MERKRIPKFQKDFIYFRQNNRCAICPKFGRNIHHIYPVALGGTNIKFANLVLLCEEHHNKFHLGDPETLSGVFEYAYYLIHQKLPKDPDSLLTAEKTIETIKKTNSSQT